MVKINFMYSEENQNRIQQKLINNSTKDYFKNILVIYH